MIRGLHFIGVHMLCWGFVSTSTISCHLYILFQVHHTAEYSAVQWYKMSIVVCLNPNERINDQHKTSWYKPYVRICAGFNNCSGSVSSDLMKFGWFMSVI